MIYKSLLLMAGAILSPLAISTSAIAAQDYGSWATPAPVTPISRLPAARTPLDGTEVVPMVQMGQTVGAAVSAIQVPAFVFNNSMPTAGKCGVSAQNSSLTSSQAYHMTIANNYQFSDNVCSTIAIQPGTTVQQVSAYSAYVVDACPRGSAPHECNGVGLFSQIINSANGAGGWPINAVCNDNGFASDCDNEFDITAQNSGAIYAMWVGEIQGAVQPASANGIQLSQVPGAVAKWTNGFTTGDGAANNFASIGALATSGTNVPSQPFWMNSFDNAGHEYALDIQTVNHAVNFTDNTLPDYVSFSAGNANVYLEANSNAGHNVNLNLVGGGTGEVVMKSVTSMAPSAASGTNISSLPLWLSALNASGGTYAVGLQANNDAISFQDSELPNYAALSAGSGNVTIEAAGTGNANLNLQPLGSAWVVSKSTLQVPSVYLAPTTFAGLPGCAPGMVAYITDASTPITTWHQQVTAGGGSNSAFVTCDAGGWFAFSY